MIMFAKAFQMSNLHTIGTLVPWPNFVLHPRRIIPTVGSLFQALRLQGRQDNPYSG